MGTLISRFRGGHGEAGGDSKRLVFLPQQYRYILQRVVALRRVKIPWHSF